MKQKALGRWWWALPPLACSWTAAVLVKPGGRPRPLEKKAPLLFSASQEHPRKEAPGGALLLPPLVLLGGLQWQFHLGPVEKAEGEGAWSSKPTTCPGAPRGGGEQEDGHSLEGYE